MEGACGDEYAEQQARKILDRVHEGLPDLEDKVAKLMQRYCPPTAERKHYTPKQAAEAIRWKVEDLIHQVAADNGLDRGAVHKQVFRAITLSSFRLRDRPNDVLLDVMEVANDFKKSQWTGG